jgi:NIPSNAP
MITAMLEESAQAQEPETVYELRIYHLNEGKQDLILDRFRTKETKIFARMGMHGVGYWVPTEEPLAGKTLIYLLRHKSREAAKESWAKFAADPEWVALKAETEKDGAFVNQHESTFMKLTDFSPKV